MPEVSSVVIPICPRVSASLTFAKFDRLNSRSDETHCWEGGHPIRRFRGRGGITAGDTALSRDAPKTRMLAGSLSAKKLVRILVSKLIIITGKNRDDVYIAEMCWTSWKRSAVK